MRSFNAFIRSTILVSALCLGCSRFAWHEEPFTPDPAPASEILVTGRDTTYVLRGSSYYLLASERSMLWNREVMDDVAWKYRALFGDEPPVIAVRIDSARAPLDSARTWRGLPLATVVLRRGADTASSPPQRIASRMLAATAAEAWLNARALDVARAAAAQPGGPSSATTTSAPLPAWIEAGALRILGSDGAPDRAVAELRANAKRILSLAQLFAFSWPARPNVAVLAGSDAARVPDVDDASPVVMRGRTHATPGQGGSPLFIAQSVAVLTYIHERDPGLVARLADELPRGQSITQVLATSATLPHDTQSLDVAWRKWLERYGR